MALSFTASKVYPFIAEYTECFSFRATELSISRREKQTEYFLETTTFITL